MTPTPHDNAAAAYHLLAKHRYRPQAPSDGLGNITVPPEALDLEQEARDYAQAFIKEEDSRTFWIGVSEYTHLKTMVLAIEAARLCCSTRSNDRVANNQIRAILQEAIDQLPTQE